MKLVIYGFNYTVNMKTVKPEQLAKGGIKAI